MKAIERTAIISDHAIGIEKKKRFHALPEVSFQSRSVYVLQNGQNA